MAKEANEAGKIILVVEDEWLIGAGLAAELQDAGYSVVGPVGSSREALALLDAHPVHGAVLDMRLGDRTSLPVADALLARGVPFVFATGLSGGAIPAEYVGLPMLSKPVDMVALLALLRRLLADDDPSPETSARLAAG